MSEEKKLNVGLFIDTFFPMIDGVVMVVDNYARILSKTCDVTVFAPQPRKPFDDSILPYKVVRCKMLKLIGLDYDLPIPAMDHKFKKAIKDAKLDVIHIHSPFSIGEMGIKFAHKNKIASVATMHSQYKQDFRRATKNVLLEKILLKKIVKIFNAADLVLTMNQACEQLAKEYGIKRKIQLISNATDIKDTIEARHYADKIKKNYSILDEEKVFINIGRLNKLKNIDFVIDICKVLKDKNFKYRLFLIGSGQDENYFKSKVKKLDLKNNIIFVGKVQDIRKKSGFFSVSDLHIFPSFYDTDGIVRIEAAAFSVPTIFIKDSIASSACIDNVNSYIEENDVNKFANRIIDIFKDKESYEKVRKNCYKDIYITWDKVIENICKIYQKLIQSKRKENYE